VVFDAVMYTILDAEECTNDVVDDPIYEPIDDIEHYEPNDKRGRMWPEKGLGSRDREHMLLQCPDTGYPSGDLSP
jgi:hypothetical protein